ncbi:hypothetical protein ABZ467_17930 [Streptomyces sp. NPDC005727]|uniref:hypothetical protein n=1 Tax=Streptomyces sp. NPDC005727 TaxID=3157053 RepID=UPI003403531C
MHYRQFQVSDEEGPAGADLPREHNGLIEVQDGIATVQTGIYTGEVDVITVLRQPDSGLPGRRADARPGPAPSDASQR